jgi:hypothetical protein
MITVHCEREAGDVCFAVLEDGEWIGDIEQLSDGTWIGDVTQGNGPPSKPHATRDEAVAWVVHCGLRYEPVEYTVGPDMP